MSLIVKNSIFVNHGSFRKDKNEVTNNIKTVFENITASSDLLANYNKPIVKFKGAEVSEEQSAQKTDGKQLTEAQSEDLKMIEKDYGLEASTRVLDRLISDAREFCSIKYTCYKGKEITNLADFNKTQELLNKIYSSCQLLGAANDFYELSREKGNWLNDARPNGIDTVSFKEIGKKIENERSEVRQTIALFFGFAVIPEWKTEEAIESFVSGVQNPAAKNEIIRKITEGAKVPKQEAN